MNQGQDSGGMPSILYYVLAVILLCVILFYFLHDEVIYLIFVFNRYELALIAPFSAYYQHALKWIELTPQTVVDQNQLYELMEIVGNFLKWPVLLLSAVFVYVLHKHHPGKAYANVYSMQSLHNQMKEEFPVTLPVYGKKLEKVSINQGEWAMALTPVEFMQQHKLIITEEIKGAPGEPSKKKHKVNHERAQRVFIDQLGPVWGGFDLLKPHEKALFAIFAAFACYARDDGEAALAAISASLKSNNGEPKYSAADKLFDRYLHSEAVQKVTGHYYYTYTVFSALLLAARNSGIVAASNFLWLKRVDRKLWYCLNNVGRRAVYVEGAAIRAHYLAERDIGAKVAMPMIDSAVTGLEAVFETVEIN